MPRRTGRSGIGWVITLAACAPIRAALAAEAPAESASLGNSVLALIVPLMVIVLALAALWWVLRKRGTYGTAKGPARVVQILAVGPRERILLIDHRSRRLMVGVTATSIRLIADLDRDTDDDPASVGAALSQTGLQ